MKRFLCVGATALLCAVVACSSDDDDNDDACVPDDADGIANQDVTVALSVSDTAFGPLIITTQNTSTITLTLTNTGTRPHGFSVAQGSDCYPTPNQRGCPAQICFPAESTIAPIAPGASATVKFMTPAYEAIYTFRSQADGDSAIPTGQFVLK